MDNAVAGSSADPPMIDAEKGYFFNLAAARARFAIAAMSVSLIAFQLALNLMFSPLGALLADHVADRRKGRL